MMKIKVRNPQSGNQGAAKCFPVFPDRRSSLRKPGPLRNTPGLVWALFIFNQQRKRVFLGEKRYPSHPPPLPWISPGEKRLERKGCSARPL